jgi:hypothetical protein
LSQSRRAGKVSRREIREEGRDKDWGVVGVVVLKAGEADELLICMPTVGLMNPKICCTNDSIVNG